MAHEIEYGLVELAETPSFRNSTFTTELAREIGSILDKRFEDIERDISTLQDNIYTLRDEIRTSYTGVEATGIPEFYAFLEEVADALDYFFQLILCNFYTIKEALDTILPLIPDEQKKYYTYKIVELRKHTELLADEYQIFRETYESMILPAGKHFEDVDCYKRILNILESRERKKKEPPKKRIFKPAEQEQETAKH
jgi:hypothetical protein